MDVGGEESMEVDVEKRVGLAGDIANAVNGNHEM